MLARLEGRQRGAILQNRDQDKGKRAIPGGSFRSDLDSSHADGAQAYFKYERLCRRLQCCTSAGGRGFFTGAQLSGEEIGSGLVSLNPVLVHEKVMNLIREDQLFKLDVLFAKSFDQLDGL